jgi:hypothetical protein
MKRDDGLGAIWRLLNVTVVHHHLDHEQLLALFLVSLHKQIIIVETIAVLAPLCDLSRHEVLDSGVRGGARCPGGGDVAIGYAGLVVDLV